MEDNKKNEPMSTEPLSDEVLDDAAGGVYRMRYTAVTCQRCHRTFACASRAAAQKFTYCDQCRFEMDLEERNIVL